MAAVPELTPYALPAEALSAESEKSSLSAVEAGVVDEKRLLRRIDLRILPFVWWSYCVMRVDVGNISNGESAEACRRKYIADAPAPFSAGIMNTETGHSIRQELKLTPQQ